MTGAEPLTPNERRAYRSGCRSFARGDLDGTLSHFGRLLHTREEFADVHYMMGVAHGRRNDLDEAANSLRVALRINPGYAEARLALANVYELQGDFDASRELVERAHPVTRPASDGVLDPTTRGKLANLQAELGDAYREAGELGEAIEAYRKALDRCPDFHDIRHRLGVALRDAGLPDRALAEFGRVLRGNPDFLDAAVQLGLTLYSLGRSDEAASRWREVLGRDPAHADARMYLRMIQVG